MDGFVSRIHISDTRQFKKTQINFCDQEGKPLRNICLIGSNGAGKSTIIKLLRKFYQKVEPRFHSNARLEVTIDSKKTFLSCLTSPAKNRFSVRDNFTLLDDLDGSVAEAKKTEPLIQFTSIFAPPDGDKNNNLTRLNEAAKAKLQNALTLLKKEKNDFAVGQESAGEFWTLLIALIKDREAKLLEFQKRPENQERTIKEVEAEFKQDNPEILKELADLWQPLLDRSGLIFDYESASIPVQLNDNLEVFLKPKNSNSSNGHIPYAHLSTGIRSFLFRLGHIFCIQRYSKKPPGILLVDEPENSLHPDFLFDILSHYQKAAPGFQIFMATHSPIVAAQFKPEERFILELDPEEGVTVRKGITPEGDDPNDILLQDFSVKSLYGPAALKSWQRFRELEKLLSNESNPEAKRKLATEYLQLGSSYNFRPDDEISG